MSHPEEHKTPGQLIQQLLDDRGWSQRVLAFVIDVDETTLNKIIVGKRSLDAELAIKLGAAFSIEAERFIFLQTNYDLALARLISKPDLRLEARAQLYQSLPIADMVKRGWLPGVTNLKDIANVESGLCRFFGKESMEDVEALPHAAKKTDAGMVTTPAQMAWLHRVQQIADEMLVGEYSQATAEFAVDQLRSLLNDPANARKVPRILSDAGIRFVVVESLPSAKIDGACFWLSNNAPVIGMSMRFDRIDNFWFVLRHEMEHVLRGDGRAAPVVDAELEGDRAGTGDAVSDAERAANSAAANFCVDQAALQRFIDRKSPFFAEKDIIGFARTLKIHPGLVAGQLQHRLSRYDRFRSHLSKIRSSVLPSATADGWGDVVPVES